MYSWRIDDNIPGRVITRCSMFVPVQLPHMLADEKKRLQRDLVRRACKRVV